MEKGHSLFCAKIKAFWIYRCKYISFTLLTRSRWRDNAFKKGGGVVQGLRPTQRKYFIFLCSQRTSVYFNALISLWRMLMILVGIF